MRKIRIADVVLLIIIATPLIIAKIKSADNRPTIKVEPETGYVVETEVENVVVEIPRFENVLIAQPQIETSEPNHTPNWQGLKTVSLPIKEQQSIKEICDRHDLAYELMMAIAKQESGFNKDAFNSVSNDYGLFQINEATWDDTANKLGFTDYRTNYKHNTEMACRIMNYCLDLAKGDLRIALNYYRTGTPNNKYEAGSDYASIVMNNINEIMEGK